MQYGFLLQIYNTFTSSSNSFVQFRHSIYFLKYTEIKIGPQHNLSKKSAYYVK